MLSVMAIDISDAHLLRSLDGIPTSLIALAMGWFLINA
jgi:hypothetical protein